MPSITPKANPYIHDLIFPTIQHIARTAFVKGTIEIQIIAGCILAAGAVCRLSSSGIETCTMSSGVNKHKPQRGLPNGFIIAHVTSVVIFVLFVPIAPAEEWATEM
ncbi:hypothetical protein [Alicyclobacillus sp. ALC3]|uniref:hypothetical protein n=1 Tax=Alicyclobacillus sp. ALC3 TaxID=2796143 RepID=UPI0023794D4B|nr:hypothetical protein [Alicyclobacillus sp. ALC3]WDL97161.1 hypothetical protein JC200_23375 [Alicyclobacillus sp. ALC3]